MNFGQRKLMFKHLSGWRWVVLMFISSRLLVGLAAFLGQVWFDFPQVEGLYQIHPNQPLLDAAARWDSGFYLEIAQSGYRMSLGEVSSVAFFPLYPLLLRLFASVFGDFVLGGLVLNHLCFLMGLWVVFRFAQHRLGTGAARATVTMLCFFPTSFYFSVVYTESVFFMFNAMFFYALQKKHIQLASGLALLACSTRFIGLLLCLVLWLQIWSRPKAWLWAVLPVFATLSYMFFLQVIFADPIAFWTVQPAFGRDGFNPVLAISHSLEPVLRGEVVWNVFLDLGILALVLFCLPTIWRIQPSYALYAGLSLILPLFSGTGSLSRYALVIVPFMLLGKRFSWVTWLFSSALLFVLTMLFATWRFVA
jgi:hypothetical protein